MKVKNKHKIFFKHGDGDWELKEQNKGKCKPNKREENKIILHFNNNNKKNIITQSFVLSMFILGVTDLQSSSNQTCPLFQLCVKSKMSKN